MFYFYGASTTYLNRFLVIKLFCIGIFPDPEHDPIIQIANMVTNYGESRPFIRNVFTLDTCAPIVGSYVFCFTTETEMLSVISFLIFIPYLIISLSYALCVALCFLVKQY